MKAIIYRKTVVPAFTVEARIDVETPIADMQQDGYEATVTVMELEGLTDSAISQGMDIQLRERSFQELINVGRAVPVDEIQIVDYANNGSFIEYTRLLIVANDDSVGGIDGGAGAANVINVLDNDTLDGNQATTSNVILSEVSNDSSGAVTLNADGSVDVAAATPANTYNIVYQICEIANPANCDTGTAQITVI